VALLTFGCGPELERVSELNNLRVLGVQKDKPYAAPGEEVNLAMLWEDGSQNPPRNVQIFWIGDCENPPGDLYAGCALQWADLVSSGNPPTIQVTPMDGPDYKTADPTFTVNAAPLRPVVQDPKAPPSGLSFAFFGVCAGRLDGADLAARFEAGEITEFGDVFPRCLDENDEPLGGNDYVIGYTTVYSYEAFVNDNPIVTGFQVGGEDVTVDCIGVDCIDKADEPEPLTECEEGFACIDSCEDDGDPSCPEISIKPIVDPVSAELDGVASQIYGRDNDESLWINYLVDRGSVLADVKLLNDGVTGWNTEYEDEYFAPKETGPIRIWAVVHDNRGGVNWVRVRGFVR
jgi:hypothetical protein